MGITDPDYLIFEVYASDVQFAERAWLGRELQRSELRAFKQRVDEWFELQCDDWR